MKADKISQEVSLALESAGIAKTPQRLAVFNIMFKAEKPLNAADIRQIINTKSSIDKVTVYRIISLFIKSGIIREIISKNGANYFEVATTNNPVHPHFNCRTCGQLSCLAALTFSQANQLIAGHKNYSVDHIEINISGICSNCHNAIKLQKQPDKKRAY